MVIFAEKNKKKDCWTIGQCDGLKKSTLKKSTLNNKK